MAYSHRDRRAHRTVQRGLAALTVTTFLLVLAALLVPVAWVGLLAVVTLGIAGLLAVAWGHLVVAEYSTDLRRYREGAPMDGFARAELSSRFELDRPAGPPSGPSPHRRAGARARRAAGRRDPRAPHERE